MHLCSTCLVSAHRQLPTHHVSKWNGVFWEDACLSDLGLVLYLDHGGKKCPQPAATSELWVGDISGFRKITVQYCGHSGAAPPPVQLLHAGLFPCSERFPQSAFTISLLEHHDISTTLGAMSTQKYYAVLEKLTSPGFPSDVRDRYRELHATHRRYCHLKNMKRSGKAYVLHPLEKHRTDQAVQCVACPAPGFNFNPALVPEFLM